MTEEHRRLEQATRRTAHWRRWGPYLSERQWGTVREDYSPGGTAWEYFPHDHARSRAYRWGEDGLAGVSDNHQRLCFALALWNGRDPILKERLFGGSSRVGWSVVAAEHATLGRRWLVCEGAADLLFTENETNARRLWGAANPTTYVKDAFDDYVVHGRADAVNPAGVGTKAAAHYRLTLAPGEARVVCLRLTDAAPAAEPFGRAFDALIERRRREADEFYATVVDAACSEDARAVARQAFAGMLWSKQFYHLDVKRWLTGDPGQPPPPRERLNGRNARWTHLYNADIVSMPDKWEYPWYAAWDLAFHTIALPPVDPDFAKSQLILFLREWYLHPNGQIPAYEWAFADVNPPVHAWAVWRVYEIDRRVTGVADRDFLEKAFQKLLLNFTWWVNRKDTEGMNVFEGGFLGLDNIGVFDRSAPLPTGGHIEQSDGTSWMGMYCLNMLAIALELSQGNPAD